MTPTRPTRSQQLPARLLGLALGASAALVAARQLPLGLPAALVLAAAGFGYWAGPPLSARQERPAQHWQARLSRHRNTALAAGSVVLATGGRPPAWLAVEIAALLLGYLLLLDTESRGHPPTGPRQALAAVTATALVLLAAFAPTSASTWARLPALLGVLAATAVLTATLWPRRRAR